MMVTEKESSRATDLRNCEVVRSEQKAKSWSKSKEEQGGEKSWHWENIRGSGETVKWEGIVVGASLACFYFTLRDRGLSNIPIG